MGTVRSRGGYVERTQFSVKWFRVLAWFCVLAVFVPLASPIEAQVTGPLYQVNVRGVPMYCQSYFGEPVAVYLNYQLDNVGVATRQVNGAPVLIVNPNVTNLFSDLVTQWWFAHECAHHALPPNLNSETNADCFAVRELRRVGLLYTPEQLYAFAYELRNLPGSAMGHLPGPIRAQNIAQCALN
jgi:hypothetical protein